jgi:quercetin dioxygenase-like cupin family protein
MTAKPLLNPAQAAIISLPDETRFAPNGIVSRTVYQSPAARVVLFGFAEGQELTEHTSTAHVLVQILSGECEFTLDGRAHTLTAGALLHLPPNLRHAVKATRPFSMLLTMFASPAG